VAGGDLAGDKRTAADLGAWLCFEDESGPGLRPPKGRTWGRRGHTPVVKVTAQGSKRVSVAAVIATPARRPAAADLPHLPGPRVRQEPPQRLCRDRLCPPAGWLPSAAPRAHCPGLGQPSHPHQPQDAAAEAVWSNLKRSLANLTKQGIDQLATLIKARLRPMQYRPGLIDGFLAKTGLDLALL